MKLTEFYLVYIKPYLKLNDKPYNRQLFNDSLDHLVRNGQIREKIASKWTHPNNKYFY